MFSLENVGFTDAFVVDPHWISGKFSGNYHFGGKLNFQKNFFSMTSKNLIRSQIAPKHSAIDVSRGVDKFYTIFFENRSVVIEIESSKVKSNTGIFPRPTQQPSVAL